MTNGLQPGAASQCKTYAAHTQEKDLKTQDVIRASPIRLMFTNPQGNVISVDSMGRARTWTK
jgi:hypothetical protein